MAEPFLPSTTRQTIRIHWRFTRKYRGEFFVGTIGAAIAVIIQNIVPPYIVALTFNKLQDASAAQTPLHIGMFTNYIVAFVVAAILATVAWRTQSLFVWRFEMKTQRDMANAIYDHLQSQSQKFHADHFGGALVSQTNKFIGAYERLMDDLVWSIIPMTVSVLASIIVLAFVSWPYAIGMTVVITVYVASLLVRMRQQMPYNTAFAESESARTAALADAITNMSTIRAFAGDAHESARFRRHSNHFYQKTRALMREVFRTDLLSHVQTNGFHVIAFIGGLLAVTNLGLRVSVLYLLVSYTQQIVNRLWEFSRLIRNLNRGFGDSVEMTEILGQTPDVVDPVSPAKPVIKHGEIVFDRVHFTYNKSANEPLFDALSLRIAPGEKVGLVGPSGGGKTSITKLLLRFMDIAEGSIRVDGQDINTLRQVDLRKHIAYVSQEPILFHRSLAENISYGNLSADRAAIVHAAKLAHADEFISHLPDGYDTMVGERGIKLSGGQRQRIAIARAILKSAPILVLDEATSALDSESEVLIQDALWQLMDNRTAVVIAHRLSTIQKMDRIVVLDKGRVVEEGTHEALLRHKGLYAKLWQHQSGGFLED